MFNGHSFAIELDCRGENRGTVYSDPLGDVWKPVKKLRSVNYLSITDCSVDR